MKKSRSREGTTFSHDSSDSFYFVQNPTTLFLPLVIGDDNRDGEPDFDEIGTFLEAQGAYTHDNTLPVYIENAVIGKGMYDEKSAEMVRIMMTNRSFDLTQAYSFPSISSNFANCIVQNVKIRVHLEEAREKLQQGRPEDRRGDRKEPRLRAGAQAN